MNKSHPHLAPPALILFFSALLAGASLVLAQDLNDPNAPFPDPTSYSSDWIPAGTQSSETAEPTPIPGAVDDTAVPADPDATPPPPDSNGAPAPILAEEKKDINRADNTPDPPSNNTDGATNPESTEGTDTATIPDPPANPDTAPSENTPYDQGMTFFQESLVDDSITAPEAYFIDISEWRNSPAMAPIMDGVSGQPPSAPNAEEPSPTTNSDVSTMITTGGGYDAWTGSVRRVVRDLSVTGSIGGEGLSFVRTYSSHLTGWQWSYTWNLHGRPFTSSGPHLTAFLATMPDGRVISFKAPDPATMPGEVAYRSSPGTKERLILHDDPKIQGYSQTGTADLYLEDGSIVHFSRTTEYNDNPGQAPFFEDFFKPHWVTDPHGLKTTLAYEQIPGTSKPNHIRLVKVTDPSQRSLTFSYDQNTGRLFQVTGSDGQWVKYTSPSGLTSVLYSDGTTATYTYGAATTKDPITGATGAVSVLFTAQDTRAEGAMRAIKYEYRPLAKTGLSGQIAAEKHLATGVDVSRYAAPDDRSQPIQAVETRGDGPQRTFEIERVEKVPLMRWKTDFKGVKQYFYYDANRYLREVKDRRGYSILYDNEPILGNPTKVTFPGGAHVDYTYSNNLHPYHIKTVKDELGRTTTYTRDGLNRITRIDYPDTSYETFTYNGFAQVTKHRRKNGAYVHAIYDGRGLLKFLWNPTTSETAVSADPKTVFTYYGDGSAGDVPQWKDRVRTITPPAITAAGGVTKGDALTYEYDRLNGAPCPGRGLVTKIGHSNGAASAFNTWELFGYDVYGNKIWEENELRQRTTYAYDDYNRQTSVQLPATTPVPVSKTTYNYTASNGASAYSHTTKSWRIKTEADGTTSAVKMQNLYDENFRLIQSTLGYPAMAATTTYGYDPNGNQTTMVSPRAAEGGNFTTTTEYDPRNRKIKVTDPLGQYSQWIYDDTGNVLDFRRPDGQWEHKTYDTMHRVLSETDPMNRTTSFTYWHSGKLKTVTDANNHTTTFYYDAADLKIQMNYPGNTKIQAWTYDERHNLKWRRTVDPNVIQTFTYDARNRKKTMRLGKWLPQSNPVAVDPANTYDWSNFFYDYADRMTIADNGVSKVERTYDAAGRLLTDKETFKDLTNGARQVTYTYYPNNKVARIYVPGGYDFMQSYDGLGRLSQIRYTGDQNASYGYFYDAASNVKRRVSWRNGTWVDYTYDHLNRIEQRDIRVPTGQIASGWFSKEHYGYDGMNRLISTEREEDGLRDSFIYDLSGQLKTAYYGLHPSGANWINPTRTVVYVWDDAGNRTQVSETGQGTKIYTPNAYNQYTAAGADAVGNGSVHEIYGYKGVRYQYYGDTFLSSVVTGPTDNPTNTYELFYDGLGRCVKRRSVTNGGTPVTNYYLYDGEHWIVEYDGTGAMKSNTVYGLGIDEVIVRGIGTGQWPLPDRNGNTSVVTGPGGLIKESYRYDAFGAPTIRNNVGTIIPSSTIGNRFLFTGREYNSLSGFYEYRARAYHPGLGRFMSEDPKGFDAKRTGMIRLSGEKDPLRADEHEYNLYRYCGNDPWDYTDPMGLESYELAQILIPGQIEYDAAVANYQAGNYGTAAAFGVATVAQAFAGAISFGQSSRVTASINSARTAFAAAAQIRAVKAALMPGGKALGQAGSKQAIREVQGGVKEAKALFQQLSAGGQTVKSNYPGTLVQLPGGGTVGIRTTATKSPDTVATVDVNIPQVPITKVKFNE